MSNKIIEEQRRAREEFIKLKKMQKGEIEPETVAEVIPLTPKEKLQNYWYHFRWHTIAAIFLVAIITFMVANCMTREKHDFIVVIHTHSYIDDRGIEKIEEYLEQYAEDINGDGKVTVQVSNCSFSEKTSSAQANQNAITRLQSMMITDEAVLYIVDEKGLNYVESLTEKGFLAAEPLALEDDFYEFCNGKEEYEQLPEGLMISYRKIKGTTLEDSKKAKSVFEMCEKLYEKLTKK